MAPDQVKTTVPPDDATIEPAKATGQIPPVNPADESPPPDPTPPPPPPVDDDGDPDLDADAPYGRKADGTPRAKPGRKGGAGVSSEQRARLESVTPAPPRGETKRPTVQTASVAVDYGALGRTAANLWFNVGQLAFGAEWAPDTAAGEHVMVADGFRDYFKAKQIGELDPTVSLVIVLGGYTLARVSRPTIKSRIAGAASWLKSKIKR